MSFRINELQPYIWCMVGVSGVAVRGYSYQLEGHRFGHRLTYNFGGLSYLQIWHWEPGIPLGWEGGDCSKETNWPPYLTCYMSGKYITSW